MPYIGNLRAAAKAGAEALPIQSEQFGRTVAAIIGPAIETIAQAAARMLLTHHVPAETLGTHHHPERPCPN